MRVLEELASAYGRNDEQPNSALAEVIVKKRDAKGVSDLVAVLTGKDKAVRNDAIKVLYEVGARRSELIATHLGVFVGLLASKDNRMVWGAMCAVDAIADTRPKAVVAALPKVMAAVDKGSVFTRDHAVKAMVKLAANKTYARTVLPLLHEPGFDYGLHAYVSNPTPQVSGPVTVVCTFDAALTYLSATPVPTNVSGNTITWDLPAYGSFGSTVCHVLLKVPAGTPLGTVLYSNFSVSNTLTESTLANNTDEVQRTVTGSYDPNVKEVRTSSGQSNTQYIIGTDEWLQYTIHFQNTGTDTAFTVVVSDTLPAAVDMGTFEQGLPRIPSPSTSSRTARCTGRSRTSCCLTAPRTKR